VPRNTEKTQGASMSLLIQIHEFLLLYAWELLFTFASVVFVCTLFVVWIEHRNEQITKNWRPYENS
jgi:hypothetical protein